MKALLNVLGWTLRASAAICITWMVVSVAKGANGLTTLPAILQSVGFHAVFALAGSQLVGLAKRDKVAQAAEPDIA
jgi:hypothetical protein